MKNVESFGIIPLYKDNDDLYVCLVKNSKGGHWGLPKGTPENNEIPLETAKRELTEETGISDITLLEKISFKENYIFEQNNIQYNKTNMYFIGFVDNMKSGNELDEIDEMKWVKIDEAKNILTHKTASDVIDELIEYVKK